MSPDDRDDRELELEPELAGEERAALDSWSVPEVPAGFADRVMTASAVGRADAPAAEQPRRARHWRWLAVVAAAAATFALWQLRPGRGPGSATGSAAPAARQSLALGGRGVAVAEPGSSLSWVVDGRGAAVAQSAGDVFYRVERGGPFRVETPHGTVRVTGTCFRVEVADMKRPWRDVAAAGIGAALVVTVYEGSVLFAGKDKGGDETRVAAGEKLVAGPGGAEVVAGGSAGAALAEEMPAAPEASASREQLLQRDAQQRAEIASLRAKLRQLAGGAGPGDGPGGDVPDPSGRPWFDPSKDDLTRFAAECRVRYDLPPVMGTEPMTVGPRMAERMGLSGEETAAYNRVIAAVHAYYLAELRKLYMEVVGDASRADELSPEALWSELRDKSPSGEEERANQKIAQERAGLAQPPGNLAALSAVERGMRLQASLGDRTERELGAVLGPERARAMREKNGGWGVRSQIAGCPGKGGEDDQVVR